MKKLNPAARTLILVCVFLLSANLLLGYVLIRDSRLALREQIESRMLDVANTAAAMLDGDALRTLKAEDTNTPAYQAAHKILTYFEENIELAYIYCVRELEDGSFVFMIDPDPEAPGAFGEHIPYTDALHEASLGRPCVDSEAYVDQWGRFYSAYSPVFDGEGQVSGIVAVDFTADWFDNQLSRQVQTTLIISMMLLLASSIIIFLVITRYRRRFSRLFHNMNLVSDAIETLVRETARGVEPFAHPADKTSPGMDEIDLLGSRINALQVKLSEQIALVRSMAYIDGLTRLGNRAAYEEHVRRIEDRICGGTAEFAVMIYDLNGLKEINDRYGHEKGDEVIRCAAAALKRVFHDGKQYRIGGDEFVVILEGSVEELQPRLEYMHSGEDGFSISEGCAVYNAESDSDYRMVFNRADLEMYNDKRAYYLARGDRQRFR